jgi:hypothetical protein
MKKEKIPFYKRHEWLNGPFVIIIGIGYILFAIVFIIIWLLKWIILSTIRPFINSTWFCKQGFHKYRKIGTRPSGYEITYNCKVCGKEKIVLDAD